MCVLKVFADHYKIFHLPVFPDEVVGFSDSVTIWAVTLPTETISGPISINIGVVPFSVVLAGCEPVVPALGCADSCARAWR